MELDVTWGRAAEVWFAFFWRNVIAAVGSVVAGGVLGAVLGIVLVAAGVSRDTIREATIAIGFVLGSAVSIIPMKMILGRDFGTFRLVLLAKDDRERGGKNPLRAASPANGETA